MNSKIDFPTIADVAQKAGVSIATVSRVINGSAQVVGDTAGKVRAAIAELNYSPRMAARVLASRRTDTIGLVLPEISGAFFSNMLRGIEHGVREAGLGLLIQSTHTAPSGGRGFQAMGEHNTDGLLIFPNGMDEKEIRRLNGLGFPLVLVHMAPPKNLHIPLVTVENLAGSRALVEHLISTHARRRIVFLRGPNGQPDSVWRERGYRQALQNHQIPFDSRLVAAGDFDDETGRSAILRLLKSQVCFDAVFAGDDEAASGVLQALSESGLSVPEDVSVAGFDDVYFARYINPPLTTVRAPTEQVGLEAVHVLLKLIRHETAPAELILPTELVIRQSCGCKLTPPAPSAAG